MYHATNVKRKATSRKHADLNNKNDKKIEELTENEEYEESDTDRLINIITKIRPLTDRKNHNTMTIRFDGIEDEIIVNPGSPITKVPPDKEKIED